MTADDAVRYLHHEAAECRLHDQHEALCLLLPALLQTLDLRPMNGYEAEAFARELKNSLIQAKTAERTHAGRY